jgi:Ricin-type beta-trefoil lectin domain
MVKLVGMVRAAVMATVVASAAALAGGGPAYADRVIPPPVDGDVLAWSTNNGPTGKDTKCMQVDQGHLDDFVPVDQFSCQYGRNQQWRMGRATDAPDIFWLQNVRTGKCLDVYAYGTRQGDPVIQYNCLVGTNQQWRMLWSYNDGYAQFQNVNSGLCLSVDGMSTADYRRYTQNPCYWWATNEQLHPILP